jgi:uncharacterized membrane protein
MDIRSFLAAGWAGFKAEAGLLIGSTLTLALAWVLLEVAVVATHKLGVAVNLGLHVAYLIGASGLELGLVTMMLDIADGKSPTYRDLFAKLRRGPHFLAAKLIYLLLLALGLISLIAPGLWLGTRYSMFPGLMADGQHNPVEALKSSSSMVRGHTGKVLIFLLILVLLNSLGACLLGLGLLLTFPTSLLAMAYLYRYLQRDSLRSHLAT